MAHSMTIMVGALDASTDIAQELVRVLAADIEYGGIAPAARTPEKIVFHFEYVDIYEGYDYALDVYGMNDTDADVKADEIFDRLSKATRWRLGMYFDDDDRPRKHRPASHGSQ
ncbi:hypothetical protein [Salinactinospora qingdaonensis]|uniref:Uncharacterized protein n=1 Tax=Salinactinospora qingdaonensis TaxID=702744 RepID=A0ABP7FQR6_9ACTN